MSSFYLRIEEDIRDPQNLATEFLNFTADSRNCVFADIGIWGDNTSPFAETYNLLRFMCIHSNRKALLIIILFLRQRRQVIDVKILFCKFLKMINLKLLSFAKFCCASTDIFLKFLCSKFKFSTGQQNSIFDNFLNGMHTQINKFTTISPTNCEIFGQLHVLAQCTSN